MRAQTRTGKPRRNTEWHLRKRIGELTRQVQALELVQKDYVEIVQHATEAIFKLDASGTFYFVSAEFGRVLGYSDDQVMGRHFSSIVHPEDQDFCAKTFNILTELGKADDNIIFRVRHHDGHYKWINCSAVCLFDGDHQPTHCIGFAHDITELICSQELVASESRRHVEATRAGARAVVDAQEKERADIGYELHDNVNQILSTARLYLDLAKNDEKERMNLIARSADNISGAVKEIRKISRSLVPGSLDDLGLIASIDDLVEDIRVTKAVSVEFCHQENIENAISEKRKLVLFRIVQEQVTNVLRHAQASQLVIELTVDVHSIYLSISDNGKGFDLEAVKTKKGVGLHNIANRAELFNGKINMVTSPGKGCKLNVLIPV